MTVPSDDAAIIAGRFLSARRGAASLADYPGDFPTQLEDAYRIQDEAVAAWNRPVIGWKVGRILPPLSAQFGTDRLAGPIFAAATATREENKPEIPVFDNGFAAGEAEFLLPIGQTPPGGLATTHQLYQPTDDQRPEADASGRIWLGRDDLRLHRFSFQLA